MPGKLNIKEESSLLQAMRHISVVTRKKGSPEQTYCRIQNHWIVASNGLISAGIPLVEDIAAQPHTLSLIAALEQCGESTALTLAPDGLIVQSGDVSAVVPVLASPLPYVYPDNYDHVADNRLLIAIELAAKSATEIISIDNQICTANVLQAWHGIAMPRLLVPKAFATALKKIDKNLVRFGYSATSVTFWFEDQSWIKTQIFPATADAYDKKSIMAFQLTSTAKKDIPAPIDPFELKLTPKHYEIMTDQELVALAGTSVFIDTECYDNLFLVCLKSFNTGKVYVMENPDAPRLEWIFANFLTIGFNSIDYDLLLIRMAAHGYSPAVIKKASDQIIVDQQRVWDLAKQYQLPPVVWNHIDLIEVAPLAGSLKLYGGRLHCKRLQELPYDSNTILTPEQITKVIEYCINDLDITELLAKELWERIDLRYKMSEQYQTDLRSKSNAQLAEAVINVELTRLDGAAPSRPGSARGLVFRYQVPKWLTYSNPDLQAVLEVVRAAEFRVDDTDKTEVPEAISKLKVTVGNCTYQFGVGGLHSSEKKVAHIATDSYKLVDRDVASYYPSIIINEYLKPKHLGKSFMTVYKSLVDSRLADKKSGNKVGADAKKIVINGVFGKFNSKWSILYAPDLLLQVTLTGQLALLMLINMLESQHIHVLSANTDGILFGLRTEFEQQVYLTVIAEWERRTGFVTEETQYSAVYSRDVNNYIAIQTDGKVKTKGAYSEFGSAENSPLSKNPETMICNDAVIAYLSNKTPIEHTINACQDICRFLVVRNVTGGAEKSGVYLGKVVRWYHSTEMKGEIVYRKNGNKVPNSDGAMPIMELPDTLPTDLDRGYYIARAAEMLIDLGANSDV